MTSATKRINLFKLQKPIVKPMGDLFVKADFERDLGEFIKKFIAEDSELAYLKEEPAELIPAVEQSSIAGIKEGVYTCLAKLLGADVRLIPEKFEYHFGNFIHSLEIVNPVETRLLADPIVQKYLTWQGQADLEVNCSMLAWTMDSGYRTHIMEPRRPKSFE